MDDDGKPDAGRQATQPRAGRFSRPAGSSAAGGAAVAAPDRRGRRPSTLIFLAVLPALPFLSGLIAGSASRTLGSALAVACMIGAAFTMQRGLAAEADFDSRLLARRPPPRKLVATVLVALAVFALSWIAAGTGLFMALLYAGLAALGTVLAYGLDPSRAKGLDREARGGPQAEAVIAAIEEATAKIEAIERHARDFGRGELRERLDRIAGKARAVLRQIERDPGDIRRSRRFLVTYLDGTRDVVSNYAERHRDGLAGPLDDSFREVLATVERVFAEQEEVLKRDDSLDLEVQIEVLKTQLEREGVG